MFGANMIKDILKRWLEQMQVLIDFDNDEEFWKTELENYARAEKIKLLEKILRSRKASDEYCFDFIKLELGRLNTLNKKRTSEYGFEKDNAVQLKVGGGKRSIGIVQRIRKNGDVNIVWDDRTSSYETPDRLIRYDKSEVKEIPHTGWDGIK